MFRVVTDQIIIHAQVDQLVGNSARRLARPFQQTHRIARIAVMIARDRALCQNRVPYKRWGGM